MTLRPCLDCGEPAEGPRCPEHTTDTEVSAAARGYDWQWTKLSKRARRLQPWCESCGAVDELQADHTPEAWERKAAGKPIRLQDVRVLCGRCNRAAGAARGITATRGRAPSTGHSRPLAQAKFELLSHAAPLQRRATPRVRYG